MRCAEMEEVRSPRREPLRFLLYSHDGMGLGHVQRDLALASALIRVSPGSSVLLRNRDRSTDRLGLGHGSRRVEASGPARAREPGAMARAGS